MYARLGGDIKARRRSNFETMIELTLRNAIVANNRDLKLTCSEPKAFSKKRVPHCREAPKESRL